MVALDVRWHLANPLRRIGVEDRATFMAKRADFRHFIDRPDFVVAPHDRHEDCVVTHRFRNHRARNHAVRGWLEEGDIEAFVLKSLARVEHSLVLVRGRDDVAAVLRALRALRVHARSALDREVVRLGRAARPHDFLRARADQRSGLLTREIDGVFALPTELVVAAGRVPELLSEIRQHRFDSPRIGAGRGGVIHVDGQFDCHRNHS